MQTESTVPNYIHAIGYGIFSEFFWILVGFVCMFISSKFAASLLPFDKERAKFNSTNVNDLFSYFCYLSIGVIGGVNSGFAASYCLYLGYT